MMRESAVQVPADCYIVNFSGVRLESYGSNERGLTDAKTL